MHTHLHACTSCTHMSTHMHIYMYTHMHICTHAYTNTPPHRTRQRHAGGVANAVVKWAIAGEKGGRKERTLLPATERRGGTALSLPSDQSQFILDRSGEGKGSGGKRNVNFPQGLANVFWLLPSWILSMICWGLELLFLELQNLLFLDLVLLLWILTFAMSCLALYFHLLLFLYQQCFH